MTEVLHTFVSMFRTRSSFYGCHMNEFSLNYVSICDLREREKYEDQK
jgi:hypothetical protein